MEIDSYELRRTCYACPGQYEVFKDGKQVGYLRMRHGFFTVRVPDAGGRIVYEAEPEGDGMFVDEAERAHYLRVAIEALKAAQQEEEA